MKRSILVVDDDPNIRKTLSRIIAGWGYDVEEATDGNDALRHVAQHKPALVLLDIQMPGMGGLEFLKKAHEASPDLAIIMVTGVEDEQQARKAMELGAADYIVKPFDFDYLQTSVKAKLATIVE